MAFYSKVIADSLNETGQRLTTLEICYPRFIHSEIMTHRDRARNSASSRAIPWPKMMERISSEPVVPIKWGMEKPGMQAGEELPHLFENLAESLWLASRDIMVQIADMMHNIGRTDRLIAEKHAPTCNVLRALGVPLDYRQSHPIGKNNDDIKIHKSLPNRLTEPWMWITVVMTATNWKNLERLRLHGDAEVHFQELMKHITTSMMDSAPKKLKFGEWHTPYVSDDEKIEIIQWTANHDSTSIQDDLNVIEKISTARCARVSYLTQDGKRDFSKDIELFDRLCQGSGFGHWSPHEHVAMSSTKDERSGPYRGWKQFRKLFPNECGD